MNVKDPEESGKVRISVSFPDRSYRELERIALAKRVSLAWVVREAVDSYLQKDVPLFQATGVKLH